jgi:hypothetical protein
MKSKKVVSIDDYMIKKAKEAGIWDIIKASSTKPSKYLTPEQQRIFDEIKKNYE